MATSEKTAHILETQQLRYNPDEKVEILTEYDKVRGNYYVKYKLCDLKFHQRMIKIKENEKKQMYEKYGHVDDKYFEPEIKFHDNILYVGEPILYMSQVALLASLENLCWAIYLPYANHPRTNSQYYQKICLLYELIEFRLRYIFNFRNNLQILDSEFFVIKFSETNSSVNMYFLQFVGAYLDQLYLTIYEDPLLIKMLNTPMLETNVSDINQSELNYVYKTFLSDYEFCAILDQFNEYYANLTITPADYIGHQIKLKTPCFDPIMILGNKNDKVFKQFDDTISLQEYMKMQLFIDFMFWSAYKRTFFKEIQYNRCRILDLYVYDNIIYENLASLIYQKFGDKIFENTNKSTKLFEYHVEDKDDDYSKLQFMYPPSRN